MRRKYISVAAVAASMLITAVAQNAWALVDNSQPPTAAICSGSCGVGSGIGFSRTVEGAVLDDTTFSDVYTFSLSEAGSINGILFANNSLPVFRILDLNLILQEEGGATTVPPVSGFTVPNPPPFDAELQTAVAFSNLVAGDYQFVVSGLIPFGQTGGQYEFQGVVSQVPLPAAAWLLLSAITALIGLGKARSRPQNSSV